ncbi:MAG: PAS domain-containing protein [Nitrospirae bacterium]|nr:PAS domain-containing protein [Nitrospirota bacterium]
MEQGSLSGGDHASHDPSESERCFFSQTRLDWEKTLHHIADAITIHDTDYNIIFANSAAGRMLGTSAEKLVGEKCYQAFHGKDTPPDKCPCHVAIRCAEPVEAELFEPHIGSEVEIRAFPRRDAGGSIIGAIHIVRDISEKRLAEEEARELQARLFHAQKMESIGMLASGLAHNFNNILAAINGNAGVVLHLLPDDSPLERHLLAIMRATESASAITRELFAFSRNDPVERSRFDLNELVSMTCDMLAPTIPSGITVERNIYGKTVMVEGNRSQMEQAFINLAVNAVHAMPSGGRLTVTTTEVTITKRQASAALPAGIYAMLCVNDTGIGMDDEVMKHIFDPFFTTRSRTKGMGLGLATVYGVVRRHNGYIVAESAPGEGALFRMYLPLANASDC